MGSGCPLTIRLGGLGSVVSSLGGDGPGGSSPGRQCILCIFEARNKPPGTVFVSDGGGPERRGVRENFPPFTPLDGPGLGERCKQSSRHQVAQTSCDASRPPWIQYTIHVVMLQ